MGRTAYLLLLMATLMSLGVSGIACQSSPSAHPDESLIRQYADSATEVCLHGLSEGDLEKYTQHANDDFKAAVTQEMVNTAATQLENQLGSFKSIEFLSIDQDEDYTIVHYRATYASGDVGVRMVFDRDQLIAGQWFE